jgi:6,7-dimethyl-8-ribityllumazine synthase
MIRQIKHENSTLYFVADDMGMPVSFGYLTREQAEQVESLIESSGGQASIPQGVDIDKILRDYR